MEVDLEVSKSLVNVSLTENAPLINNPRSSRTFEVSYNHQYN